MQQNNNNRAKHFKLHRNSRMAKQDLTKAKSDFNNRKNFIRYRLFISKTVKRQLIDFIQYSSFFYLLCLGILFVPILLADTGNIDMIKTIKNFVFSVGNIFFLFLVCLLSYISARNKIVDVFILRKHKTIIIRDKWKLFGGAIKFAWHSNNYLPEFSLPETEQEKYKEMQQNLQQAIALETGLKFDTQQFLLQNKGKLGI